MRAARRLASALLALHCAACLQGCSILVDNELEDYAARGTYPGVECQCNGAVTWVASNAGCPVCPPSPRAQPPAPVDGPAPTGMESVPPAQGDGGMPPTPPAGDDAGAHLDAAIPDAGAGDEDAGDEDAGAR